MSNIVSLKKFRKARDKKATQPRADSLSFVTLRKPRGTGRNNWDVKPTGDYVADCDAGHALADEYLAFIGAHPTYGNGTLLTCIVRDMIDQAKAGASWSGLHVGFLAGVNHDAMTMAHVRNVRDAVTS